ncbi:MAG: ORF6N domain-containing protein [Bacteroidia bacterium]|nr:ORF6N domain-containing protein [Bacteroidia bacterium]
MKEKKEEILPDEVLLNKIYFLREEKVLLDSDLALLYGVKPRRLREQVKRNVLRFPVNFMFQLNETEVEIMVSQNVIPSMKHLGGHLPYAFTEHGVLMLANVLKSERAIKISIRIIELFVKLRKFNLSYEDLRREMERIKSKLDNHDKNVELLFSYFDELIEKKEKRKTKPRIGFKMNKK